MKTDFIHDAGGVYSVAKLLMLMVGVMLLLTQVRKKWQGWRMVVHRWWYMKAVKAGGALSFAMGHSMALSFATLNS